MAAKCCSSGRTPTGKYEILIQLPVPQRKGLWIKKAEEKNDGYLQLRVTQNPLLMRTPCTT